MMRRIRRPFAFISATLVLSACTTGAEQLRYDAGRLVSTRMLQDLINPYRSEYRIALINGTTGTALLLSSPGEAPRAEFVRGHQNWLWAQAAEQLASPQEQISLRVERRRLHADNCPALPQALDTFLTEARPLLAAQFSGFPAAYDAGAAATRQLQEITIDGPTLLLQVIARDSTLTFTLHGQSGDALLTAFTALHSALGTCELQVEPQIESIYGTF